MATGTLQVSGDVPAQIEQMIQTLGGTVPTSAGKTDLLKALNSALAGFYPQGSQLAVAPAGAVAESIPRAVAGASVTIATVSGTLLLTALYIPVNTVVNNINFVIGTTGSGTAPTHNWAVLANASRSVLAVSADNTSAALTASAPATYALSAPYTTPTSGLYYAGFLQAGATQVTLYGITSAGTADNGIAPVLCGASNTGATTPPALASTLTAITVSASQIYAYLT